jgi:thiol-disulfide isomerase/thioredoxin
MLFLLAFWYKNNVKGYKMLFIIIFQLLLLQNLFAENLPVGIFDADEWLMNVSNETFDYKHDSLIVSDIKTAVNSNHSFYIFAASWCGDSKLEVPKMLKIMKQINPENIYYYNLDRNKEEPLGIARANKIERVPTLIIKYHNNEIGRIVEYPDSTIEYDINEILKLKCCD